MNISSAIVHARPGAVNAVKARLSVIDGIEIQAVTDAGRMIVTIETEGDGSMADAFDAINKMDGVLSASMVFHQTESDPDKEV